MKIYLNGKFVDKEDAKISVFDHGYLYGDGVFEGIREYNGTVFRLDEHLDRLYGGAKAVMLDIPLTKEEMKEALCETLRQNNLKDSYIRLVVSRGEGDLGLDPRKCSKPTVVIIASSIQLYSKELYDNGMKAMTTYMRRNSPASLDPQIKSLNYLNNILAKIEANRCGYAEAIFLNENGYVAECTGDNIFIAAGGALITPPVTIAALGGITRKTSIEIAQKLGIKVEEKQFTLYNLYSADECFLTGTAAEAIPVVEIDGRVIGTGKPGPITKKILNGFTEVVDKIGTKVY